MELLFVVLGGVILGLAARYALPERNTHGVLLMPALGAILSSVIWVALTWLRWPWDGGWIWVVTFVGTGLVVLIVDLTLGARRNRADERLLSTLSRGTAT